MLFVLALSASMAWADARTFELRHRSAREIAEQVRALLSADGALVVDDAANALIVRDTTAVLRDMEKLVARLDAPTALWRVALTPTDSRAWFTATSKEMEFVDIGPWRIATLPPEGPTTARVTSSAEADVTTLRVRAGESATIAVGHEARIDDVERSWFGRHGIAVDLTLATARAEISIRVSGSGGNTRLTLTPRVIGNSPNGSVVRELDAIDFACLEGRRVIVAIRSGDARDVWGPAGAGVASGWILTLRQENTP